MGLIIAFLVSCNSLNNNAEWIYLFDWESTNGWRAYNGKEIPSKWAAIDGNLTFDTQLKKEENWEGGGDIIYYLEEFDNFISDKFGYFTVVLLKEITWKYTKSLSEIVSLFRWSLSEEIS